MAVQASCNAHHDIHTRELRPHLEGTAQTDTTQNARFEQVEVGLGPLGALKVDLALDFLVLENNKVVVLVALAVEVSQNLQGLILPISKHLAAVILSNSRNTNRLWSINQRGLSGKTVIPKDKMMAGIICSPHGIRKDATPLMYEQPNWMKYWIKIPHVIDHCCNETMRPRICGAVISD
jgi:hypothetical protein